MMKMRAHPEEQAYCSPAPLLGGGATQERTQYAHHDAQRPQVVLLLQRLPQESAVKRDAERAEQFKEWRAAQEQGLDGVDLEQQNARDAGLDSLMRQTMRSAEGRIEYQEHFLPMPDGRLTQSLAAQVPPLCLLH